MRTLVGLLLIVYLVGRRRATCSDDRSQMEQRHDFRIRRKRRAGRCRRRSPGRRAPITASPTSARRRAVDRRGRYAGEAAGLPFSTT